MSKQHQRAKGTGCLYKPKDSRFWRIAFMSGGKRVNESTKKIDKGDAQKVLNARLGEVEQGIEVTPKLGKKTLGDGFKSVIQDQKLNGKRSVDHTQRRVDNHLLRLFAANRRMSTITTGDVRDYSSKRMAEGAAAASINLELATIKRAFKLAIEDRELMHAPKIPMLELNNVRTGFFEREQFEAVRDALPHAVKGMATLAYYTGLRVGEIKSLEWSQVNRSTQTIRLEPGTTKNDEGRTIPYGLAPELVTVMKDAWEEHERLVKAGKLCPHVFQRSGVPIKSFDHSWKKACREAGCPGKRFHDFRRTAVRNLVQAGVPEKTAMMISGHKDPAVFQRYHIVNEADRREALGRVAQAQDVRPQAGTGKVKQFRRRG